MILHTMNKISIKESVLMACIIEAIQASLFDDGVSPEQEELYNKKKIARQNAAKKAAQTRSVNKPVSYTHLVNYQKLKFPQIMKNPKENFFRHSQKNLLMK